MPESWWGNAIFSLIPTIVLGLIFWMVLRSIIRGDRTARRAYERIEAEERAKLGLPPKGTPAGTPAGAEAPIAAAPPAPATDHSGSAPAPGERTSA
ncbi:hypothetical protein AA0Z99_10070 [Agrococcus sp. 1P02AA]|uniref:hypothetical protein n=1 Tax=Agrococcus sp. 1P02AA TaxID=3132259 RepID=UPI0039A4EAB6